MKKQLLIRVTLLCLVAGCPFVCATADAAGCCEDAVPAGDHSDADHTCFCSSTPLPAAGPTVVTLACAPLIWVDPLDDTLATLASRVGDSCTPAVYGDPPLDSASLPLLI